MKTSIVEPFKVEFSTKDVSELVSRLEGARWPNYDIIGEEEAYALSKSPPAAHFGLKWGPSVALMKELASEWQEYLHPSFSAELTRLNNLPHYTTHIEGLRIHFIHVKSRREGATPLILCHGWPGSFCEFVDIADQLANPSSNGSPAFDVVIPSMPGFTFSSPPPNSKWQMNDTARVFDTLMTSVLGYNSYYAQGGDWGSVTARLLGALHPACKGVHLNFCPVPPAAPLSWINPKLILDWAPRILLSDHDRSRLRASVSYLEDGSAYYVMQNKTPRTPAYGLNDSPIGLLAWIGEKIEPSIARVKASRPEPNLTRKDLYLTCSLYWLTGSIMSSFTPYAFNRHFAEYLVDKRYYLPNMAVSHFPYEIAAVPKAWVSRTGNLKWYKVAEEGGHFASLEEPEIFVRHVREAMTVLSQHPTARI